jgi:hypothetical protein
LATAPVDGPVSPAIAVLNRRLPVNRLNTIDFKGVSFGVDTTLMSVR